MPDLLRPLHHHDAENLADDDLRREARGHLARNAHLQVIAELITKLRSLGLSWWTPTFAREAWPARARMRWYAQRPDLRQQITSALTGLPTNTARRKSPEFQADLIEAAIDDGDVTVERFEAAFDPSDLASYGPAFEYWAQFRDRMPWEDDSPVHQKLVAWLMKALLSDRSGFDGNMARKPILTAWDVRTAIDARVWATRIPVEVRVAIDEARLRHERNRPREPFQARHELSIAVPEIITANVPLADLTQIIAAAERAMGYEALTDGVTNDNSSAEVLDLSAPQVPVTQLRPRMTGT